MVANAAASRNFEIVTALAVLATVTVCLRFVAKRLVKASYWADDYWIIASLVVMFGFLADCAIMVFVGGIGKHITELTPTEYKVFFRAGFAVEILYFLAITPVKISVLFLYGRLFPTRMLLLVAKIVGAVCIAWCLASVLVTIFQCNPVASAWNPPIGGQCVSYFAHFQLGVAISNMLTEIIILCIPLPIIWRLSLPARDKAILSGMFFLGSFVCVASVMRIVTIADVEHSDASYTALPGATWSVIEAELAIICACLPTLRPLISKTEWVQRTRNRLSTYSTKSRISSVSRYFVKQDSWSDRVISLAATDTHISEGRPHSEVGEDPSQSQIITVGMVSQDIEWDDRRIETTNHEVSKV
ncbi:MAG: hypothetical protein Q9187_005275 [Circinaria calcarea]